LDVLIAAVLGMKPVTLLTVFFRIFALFFPRFLSGLWDGADKDLNRAINHLLGLPEEKVGKRNMQR
jgi:hypothetical protein